jgi:hypothetical protein
MEEHHEPDRAGAKLRNFRERHARAEQRDAQAQQRLCGKVYARNAAAFHGKKVKGHTEEQREQHDGRGVVLAQKSGRCGNGEGNITPGKRICARAPSRVARCAIGVSLHRPGSGRFRPG